jgi:hypothetical protein
VSLPVLLLLTCCQGGPVEERFLLTVDGVPLAVLQVSVRQSVYRYEATTFLDEGDEHLARSWTLDGLGEIDGRGPEVLTLLGPPLPGCRQVLEERRGVDETLCVDERTATRATGRLDGVPFAASYERERLVALELPGARWARLEGSAPHGQPRQVFGRGFLVRRAPGPVRLEPALPGARLVTEPVTGTGGGGSLGRQRCLSLAKQAVAADPHLELVLGLVLEAGRAYPHAWVRDGHRHQDPSILAADTGTLGRRAYLELPRSVAGRAYLELVAGTLTVVGGRSP